MDIIYEIQAHIINAHNIFDEIVKSNVSEETGRGCYGIVLDYDVVKWEIMTLDNLVASFDNLYNQMARIIELMRPIGFTS